jgi:lipopolysaccharide export system permease protein
MALYPNIITKYLAKEFLKIFFLVILSVFILIFIVDFLEFSSNIQRYSIPPIDSIKIILYRVPLMLETFLQFIILLSINFTLTKMSTKSELTILYASGYSTWKILKIYSIIVFGIGSFVVLFSNLLSSNLYRQSKVIENTYTKNRNEYFIELNNGLWFKQIDEKNNNIIIRAGKVYLDNLTFEDIIIIFNDKDKFEKRYNVEKMVLTDGFWILYNVNIVKKNEKIVFEKKNILPTQLSKKFVRQQIQNRYEDVNLIPFFSLNKLIKEFKSIGLDSHRFIIKKHSFILTPFMYTLMIMVGILFSDNNQRSSKYSYNTLCTVIIGICVFIVQNILFDLASVDKINIIFSTWGNFLFISIIICTLLIKKIELKLYSPLSFC